MAYFEFMRKMFPDAYNKNYDVNLLSRTSNLSKFLLCIAPEMDSFFEACEELKTNLDFDITKDYTLDLLAANVNQQRGSVSDSVLRTLIKTKIAIDNSEATIDVILNVINNIIGDNEHKSELVELFNDLDHPEEAAFQIKVPIDGILKAGLSLDQFATLMNRVRAGGVRIRSEFKGTFEFGKIEDDNMFFEFGFADTEQTQGGMLGALYDPNEDEPLPI